MTPKRRLPNYIRAARLRSALSQKELAYLMGCRGGKWVSRFELFERQPTLEAAMGLLMALGVTPEDLFGGKCDVLREGIARRAKLLERKLKLQRPTATVDRKRETLQRILNEKGSSTQESLD